jgi:hypothetical protein
MVESDRQALALSAVILRRGEESVDLAKGAIVRIDETRCKERNRMPPEIRGQVADTQAVLTDMHNGAYKLGHS